MSNSEVVNRKINDNDAEDHSSASLSTLIRHHQGAVRWYLARILGAGSETDDLAQDVFVAYLQKASAEQPADPRRWLLGTARNLAAKHLRTKIRQRNREQGLLQIKLLEWRLATLMQGPLEQLEHEHQVQKLRWCLEQLSPGSRKLVSEHYFHGRQLVDIADELGRREGTIRMLLLRIRKSLAECVMRDALAKGSAT